MYYEKHIFFCINKRDNGRKCCEDAHASAMQAYTKAKLKALNLPVDIRVNTSGCLGRCQEGPTIVIYPDGVWYTYVSEADIDEIIESHIVHGEVVTRLLMAKKPTECS